MSGAEKAVAVIKVCNDIVFCYFSTGIRAGRRPTVADFKGLQISGVAVIASLL